MPLLKAVIGLKKLDSLKLSFKVLASFQEEAYCLVDYCKSIVPIRAIKTSQVVRHEFFTGDVSNKTGSYH